MPSDDLKKLFDFVKKNEWCTARNAGKIVAGGKSRANHYLYGYSGILFEKRGLTPPQWKITSVGAFDQLVGKINPVSPSRDVIEEAPKKKSRTFLPIPRAVPPQISINELSSISVCQSCDLPIQPTGRCGCS